MQLPRAAAVLAAGLLFAACQQQPPSSPTPAAPPTQAAPQPTGGSPVPTDAALCLESIAVQNRKATPETLQVKVGCRILFTNRDEQPLQVMGPNFIIQALGKDESWVRAFSEPGTIAWVDGNDPNVRGIIIVNP